MTYHPKWMLKNVYDTDEDNVIDWKASRLAGVRQEVLQNFSDPKVLIATSSMNEVLNSADLVEAVAGNISSNSQELTIIGGSDSAAGKSWMYWNLPTSATKVYLILRVNPVYSVNYRTDIHLCNADGSTEINPPDYYFVRFNLSNSAQDFLCGKYISGTQTQQAIESVDLSANTYYLVEFYWKYGTYKVWRDNTLKFTISDTDISSILAVRLYVYDISTSQALLSKFKGNIVIIYE